MRAFPMKLIILGGIVELMGPKPFIFMIKDLKPIISILRRIKVNNTVRVFEEAFIQLERYTKCTPLVKLKKETGEPHTRARSPCQAGDEGVGVGVTCSVESSRDKTSG
jgi:hypothetical protein